MLKPEEARERYWRQVRELADKHEVSSSEARTLWRRFYKRGGIKRMMLALSARVSSGPTICPYCRDDLPVFHDHIHACPSCGTFDHPGPEAVDYECAPELVWTCPGCPTKMHQECYDEISMCTTLGCSGRRPGRPRVTARPRAVERPAATDEEPRRGVSNLAAVSMVLGLAGLVALIIWLSAHALGWW